MRNIARLLLLTQLALLGACHHLALMRSDDPVAALEQARADEDYTWARYIVENVPADDPAHDAIQKQLPALNAEIREFELRHIRQAEALAAREQWSEAFELLAVAQNNLPDSPALADTRDKLEARQLRRRNEIDGELALGEARWRLSSETTAEGYASLSRSTDQRAWQSWQRRDRQLARDLAELAGWFANREEWQQVRDFLEAARALDPDSVDDELLARARKHIQAAEKRYLAVREQRRLEQARSLLERYEATQQLDDLLAARNFISRQASGGALATVSSRVNALARQRFTADLERGDALYARGQYQQAYEVWKNIAPLQPDHDELTKKMERAEKVLGKLRHLENR
jgi:hypothetical protein